MIYPRSPILIVKSPILRRGATPSEQRPISLSLELSDTRRPVWHPQWEALQLAFWLGLEGLGFRVLA